MENVTRDDNGTEPFDGSTFTFMFFSLNIVLSVTLNVITLVVISKQVSMPEEVALVYQVHALLDMIQSVIGGIWSLTWKASKGDVIICTVINSTLPFFYYVLLFSNMASISGLCMNKYLLISHPLRYATMASLDKTKKWLVIGLVTILLVCIIYLPLPGLPFSKKFIAECTGDKNFITSNWVDSFNACFISVPIAVAFGITTWTNVGLLRIVLKQSKAIAVMSLAPCHASKANTTHQQRSNNEETNLTKRIDTVMIGQRPHPRPRRSARRFKGVVTVLLLQAAFYVCWIPGVVYFGFNNHFLRDLFDAISSSSNWIQPVAYLLSTREARKVIRNFFR